MAIFLFIIAFSGLANTSIMNGNKMQKTVTLMSGQNYCRSSVESDGYLYVGVKHDTHDDTTNPAQIVKIDLSTFTVVGVLTLTVCTDVYSLIIKGTYLYAGLEYNKIAKINLSTFTEESILTLSASGDFHSLYETFFDPVYSLVVSGDYLYAGLVGRIDKISLLTFAAITSLDVTAINGIVTSVSSGNYLYCATYDSIAKINLASLELESTLTIDSISLIVDGNYLYNGRSDAVTGNATIDKINLITFTVESTLDTGNSGVPYANFLISNNYLYSGLATEPGIIVKIDLATFTMDSTLTLGAGENDVRSLSVYSAHLYAGLYTSAGQVSKIDLGTFTEDSVLTFAGKEEEIMEMITDGDYLYAGLHTNPAIIVKLNKDTLERISSVQLPSGEDVVYAMAISGNYLYVATKITPVRIVKINLSTFTRDSSIDLAVNEQVASSMIVDDDGDYLYVGTYKVGTGTYLVKIDLSTFTRVDALLWLGILPFGLTISQNHAYVTNSVGVIKKVDLSTFTVEDSLTTSSGGTLLGLTIENNNLYSYTSSVITKISLETFTEDSHAHYSSIVSMVSDSNYLYITDSGGTLYKIDPQNFTTVYSFDCLNPNTGSNIAFAKLVKSVVRNCLYVGSGYDGGMGGSDDPAVIIKTYFTPKSISTFAG